MKYIAKVSKSGKTARIVTQRKPARIVSNISFDPSEIVLQTLKGHILLKEENGECVWWLTEEEAGKRMACAKKRTVV